MTRLVVVSPNRSTLVIDVPPCPPAPLWTLYASYPWVPRDTGLNFPELSLPPSTIYLQPSARGVRVSLAAMQRNARGGVCGATMSGNTASWRAVRRGS